MSFASIPNRPAFRAQEVCEIAGVQPYVLRGWEAEFPDLGLAKVANGPRVYRRVDVERVLQLKHLIQVEGLTLSGARRRLEEEARGGSADAVGPDDGGFAGVGADNEGAPQMTDEVRAQLQEVRTGLQWILKTLDGPEADEFTLAAVPQTPSGSGKTRKKK